MFRRRKARNTHDDLEQADQSLGRARREYNEQARKREQEKESVMARLDHIEQQNNIAAVIRRALQHGREAG